MVPNSTLASPDTSPQSSVLTLYDSDVDVITSQRMSGRFSLSVKFDKMRNIKILSHSSG